VREHPVNPDHNPLHGDSRISRCDHVAEDGATVEQRRAEVLEHLD
jgi:hypothetical protein